MHARPSKPVNIEILALIYEVSILENLTRYCLQED